MTLNDNPLVDIEKRFKLLQKRRDWLINYKSGRFDPEYEGGMVTRLYINPRIKTKKAGKLIDEINKELSQLSKIIRRYV